VIITVSCSCLNCTLFGHMARTTADFGVVIEYACGSGRVYTLWLHHPHPFYFHATVYVGGGNGHGSLFHAFVNVCCSEKSLTHFRLTLSGVLITMLFKELM